MGAYQLTPDETGMCPAAMGGDADAQRRRHVGILISRFGWGGHQAVRAALMTGPAVVSAELDG